ncbi:MAG: tetratricopeptide repeat protein [Bacteroidetes bacterium]|nr:tetratricopeptide repeat protein [Bacteroidota bacterium]
MSENTPIICSSCGIVNDATRTVCSSCGSPLTVADAVSVPAAPAAKPSKRSTAGRPQWLSALVAVFALYAVVIVILEYTHLPSGTVQRSQPAAPADHNHSDAAIVEQITSMEKMAAASPKDAGLQLQFANLLHDARFYPRAVEQYKKYLALVPDNHDARVDMGICYFESGNLTQAVQEIESVIKKQPKHQMAMFNLGVIHLSAENMAESRKWLERCRDLDPQSTAGLRAQQILQQHQ